MPIKKSWVTLSHSFIKFLLLFFTVLFLIFLFCVEKESNYNFFQKIDVFVYDCDGFLLNLEFILMGDLRLVGRVLMQQNFVRMA